MEIGKRIKKIRNDKSMKQEEFGALIGSNRSVISRLESGRQQIDQEILMKFWTTLRVSPHWLITGEDPGVSARLAELAELKSDLKETQQNLVDMRSHRDSLAEIIQLLKDATGVK